MWNSPNLMSLGALTLGVALGVSLGGGIGVLVAGLGAGACVVLVFVVLLACPLLHAARANASGIATALPTAIVILISMPCTVR
jgi:hypothetical protein